MYKKGKSIKLSLKHLNDCFNVFKEITKNQEISEDNERQYTLLLLKSYMSSDEIIDDEKIQKYKNKNIGCIDIKDITTIEKIKNIRI